MTGWKYIVIESDDMPPTPIVFPPWVQHRDVAEGFPFGKAISAGFFSHKDGRVTCYGESESLGIKSRPGDSELFENFAFNL